MSKTVPITIRMTEDWREKLEAEAREKGISRSKLIENKIIQASVQDSTLVIDIDGLKIPVEKLAKGTIGFESMVKT